MLTALGMSSTKTKQIIFLFLLGALFVTAASCNSKATDDETEIAVTPALVAVKNFYLRENDSILANLDSVFFSIDLKSGVIFNADSLPKGTDVSRLLATITFANSMTKAELTFKKGNENVTVNYLKNPDDSIDFTYPVTLDVTAQDGLNNFTYQIKVNVHNQDPDTLVWDKLEMSLLPSRFEAPVSQKTIIRDNVVITIIEEYNGEYTLATCTDLNGGIWNKEALDVDFTPSTESFTATDKYLWVLADNGILYSSEDGKKWNPSAENWVSVIGAYDNSVLGIKFNGTDYLHSKYPTGEEYIEVPVEEGFPLFHSSALGVVDTKWYPQPFAILACGLMENGDLSSSVWAYDGSNWAIINEDYLPALEMPMMARYVVYRDTPMAFQQRALDVWLLFGGVDENGKMNRVVYLSYDNGVHWNIAPELMQFPESMPSLGGADVIVAGYELSADLSDAWTPTGQSRTPFATRNAYTINGYDITWMCPYLYIFGGYPENQTLSTTIWRGVLSRLEFTPII